MLRSEKVFWIIRIISLCICIFQCESDLTRKMFNFPMLGNTLAMFLKIKTYFSNVPKLWLNDSGIILGVGLGCESERIDSGRSYFNISIDITNCYFSRVFQFYGYGGIIFIDGGSYSMKINNSMFYKCICYFVGGAIWFDSSNSYLRLICANSCSCGAYGHFARLQASQVNQVEYLSVSNCSHTTTEMDSIYSPSGNQRYDNTNSSMNNADRVSSINIVSPSSFTSSHCTFSNNKVSFNSCIEFYSTSGTITIIYANIVHNNGPGYGVVYAEGAGSRKMMYCIFQNNQNSLFCVREGSLEVSHSFIDHPESFITYMSEVLTTNNSLTHRMTFQIQFFNSLHCNADLPLSNPLSTIEQIPFNSPTVKMSKINTPQYTPYISFVDQTSPQSLLPKSTPHQSLFPEHTPHQSLFPEHTPHQSLFPIHTPYHSQNPERTNQRSFPVDFIERTPSISNDQSNNNLNEIKSNSVFMYSTGVLFIMIVAIISYNLGGQKNQNKIYSSSSLEMGEKHKREENSKKEKNNGNDRMRDHQMNDHHGYVSNPYVF